MANVPLRAYTREIEALIDRGNTDEAIAHCRHILLTFPKHLDTYRMLGKANLESKRYPEAADVFKRILLAAPDDFVSHVGMSIIFDDQKRLDETIWHMERGFEVQPSNAAVQSELQRLYGQRDGREPHKIRLTRGALAHMYVQGELHAQAIGEIRSVLAEDPNRNDMLVLLALAYFRSGQKADASETCSQLLSRFPYCLTANQILVEILPGTGMADTIPTYRNRVIELDPYAAYAPASIFQPEEAPDNAVMIERLEYTGQPIETPMDWRGSLGDASATSNAQPDWMQSARGESAAPPSTPEADTPVADEPIPDWMRAHGWGESSGSFDEAASASAETSASDGIEKADLPDWIKSMAPAASEATASAMAEPAAAEDDTMDWLNNLGAPAASPAQPESTDWLSNLGAPPEARASEPAAIPDWLSELPQDSSAEQPAAGLSNWMTEPEPLKAASEPSATPVSGIGDLGKSSADQDAAMLWLESLAAKQGAKSEELITDPNARLENPPEWVEQAQAISDAQEAASPAPSTEPVWPAVEDTGVFERPSREPALDETSVWLRKLESDEEKQPEWPADVTSAPSAEPAESVSMSAAQATSSWLENLDNEESARPVSPDISQGWAPSSEEPAVPAKEADVPTWLRDLEREREATPSSPVSSAASAADDLPSWLKDEPQIEQTAPEPTHPAEWVPESAPVQKPQKPVRAEAVKPSKPAATAPLSAARVEPARPAPKPKEPRKKVSADERVKAGRGGILPPMTDAGLDQAREFLAHAKIPDALQAYGALIRKGKMLEEITFDLKEALYRFPVEVSIWQALGDAYMRANRLQDALDAYTKAEELLR